MTSRRKIRDDVGMNLFPFLAVLICTMGSIIMLLVVMVQQARVRAQMVTVDTSALDAAQAAANQRLDEHEQQRLRIKSAIVRQQEQLLEHQRQQQLADEAQREVDDLTFQIESLRPAYEATLGDVAEQRLALSHLEQHTRQLSEQASQMQAEADLIAETAQDGTRNVESDQVRLANIKDQLASARAELDTERQKLADRSKRYALVPYDGPSGTQRPPIYIECLPDRVIMQPEKVVLIGEDFRAPLNQQNPLAIALRAKREYMLENGLLANGEEPYPLLVVRPGSASAYAAARSAMTAWESEFGYELVESEIELDYQTVDPRLATLLEDVITDARGRRKMMFAMMSRQKSRQRELLRPSMSGGFEPVPSGSSAYASRSNGDSRNGDAFERAVAGADSRNRSAFPERQSIAEPVGSRAGGFSGTTSSVGEGQNRFESQAGNGNSRNGNSRGGNIPPGELANGSGNELRFGDENGAYRPGASGIDAPRFSANGQGAHGIEGASGSGGPSSQGPSAGAASSSNASPVSGTQSLAQTRGKGWAVSGTGSDAVGVKRPIRIVCDVDHLKLIPERGSNNDLKVFRHDGSVNTVVDPFVDAVQSRVESWGFAGQGLFWRPVLQVQVRTNAVGDAETKYRHLLQLLDQSGIEVTREP